MSFVFAPKDWALCNGQLLPINTNQGLFALLGTTYGGNGQTNFGLPDLRGRIPIHVGEGHSLGERGGEQAHTLTLSELPTHIHMLQASGQPGDQNSPGGRVLARDPGNAYSGANPSVPLRAGTVAGVGGSQAHLNMQPFLTVSYCIRIVNGIFPSQV